MPTISRPINTSLLRALGDVPLRQQRRLLQQIHIQPRAHMPRNVAMERPHARVVCVVLQHEVAGVGGAATLDDLHVAALCIGLVRDGAVPLADALGEDVEVVPVEMHGVGGAEFVFDDQAHGGVVFEVVDVPFGVVGVGGVALVGEDEDRMVVVGTKGGVVHVEKVVAGGVLMKGNFDCLRHGRVGGRGKGVERDGFGEVIVPAFGVIVGSCGRCGYSVCVGLFVVDGCQGVGLVGKIAGRAEIGSHPVNAIGFSNALDDDICALANPEGDHVGRVRLYRNKVVGHDRHVVPIDCKSLNALRATVDKS